MIQRSFISWQSGTVMGRAKCLAIIVGPSMQGAVFNIQTSILNGSSSNSSSQTMRLRMHLSSNARVLHAISRIRHDVSRYETLSNQGSDSLGVQLLNGLYINCSSSRLRGWFLFSTSTCRDVLILSRGICGCDADCQLAPSPRLRLRGSR